MVEINNRTKSVINEILVKETVESFLKHYKKPDKTVSVVFVGDSEIRKLNKRYRGKDKVTDVLSFSGSDEFFGEILIDYAQIRRQAKEFSADTEEELVFILVHGLLHLLGYNDETDEEAEEMDKLGREFIGKI